MDSEQPVVVSKPVPPFSPARQLALDALIDLMIPASRDGKMPAAVSLGLYKDLRAMPAAVREQLERGLDSLDSRATDAYDKTFAGLSPAEANALVDIMRRDDPAFIGAFTLHTAARYLRDDQVVAAIGMKPRPHWPQGHEVPEGNWELLESVRQRGEIWRKA